MNEDRWAFDVEVFPNFFCCSFMEINTKEVRTFMIYGDTNQSAEMFAFMENKFIISFNGLSYDLPVLRYIKGYTGKKINADIADISSKLIDDGYRKDKKIMSLRYPRQIDYVHQDLMALMGFDKVGIGLKQVSILLKWNKVQDLPFHYTHKVQPNEVDTIVKYNINDVAITIQLYHNKQIKGLRELRESLVPEFGYDMLSASNSSMANKMLEKLYETETGISREQFRKGRSPKEYVDMDKAILPKIKFESVALNALLNDLKRKTVVLQNGFKFSEKVAYAKNVYSFGVGGLHSEDLPAIYESNENEEIISADVASFYPSIICQYGIKPEHLHDKFLEILQRVKDERLAAKHAGDTIKSESYKVLVNSVFGKFGSDVFWLYDPFALISVTINGQLFLMMLIEHMEMNGIRVISANTDGIEVILPKDKKDVFERITKQWQDDTGFELEFATYKKYIKRDVNNYIAILDNGKIKEKGIFVKDPDLRRAYRMPIIPTALFEYFVNGVPVMDTLKKSTDIMDFAVSQKMGDMFQAELHNKDGIEILQKSNRFFISNDGGSVIKRYKHLKSKSNMTGLFVGYLVTLFNDMDYNKPIGEYDINYSFYEKEIKKIIEVIEPPQRALFDLSDVEAGAQTTLEFDYEEQGRNVQRTVNGLNKLAKLQIKNEIANIVWEGGIIEGVSKKYVYVRNVDVKSATALLYSLANAKSVEVKMKRKMFDKNRFNKGDILYCDKFTQKDGVWYLDNYWQTDKLGSEVSGLL